MQRLYMHSPRPDICKKKVKYCNCMQAHMKGWLVRRRLSKASAQSIAANGSSEHHSENALELLPELQQTLSQAERMMVEISRDVSEMAAAGSLETVSHLADGLTDWAAGCLTEMQPILMQPRIDAGGFDTTVQDLTTGGKKSTPAEAFKSPSVQSHKQVFMNYTSSNEQGRVYLCQLALAGYPVPFTYPQISTMSLLYRR